MTACPICARREPADGLTIDAVCMARIDDDLARIVELVAQASDWLHPRTTGTSEGSRSGPGSRPPLSVDVLDAAIGLDVLPLLEAWIRLTREENHLAPYGAATEGRAVTVAGSVTFLRSWLLWAAGAPSWPIEDYAAEIRDARWQLERLNPDRAREGGIPVACTADHPDADGRRCGYEYRVVVGMLSQDVTCRRCGNVTTGGRMIYTALSDPAVTVWAYPDVIEATLGVKATTLRQWYSRGHIKRNGNRYDVGAAYRRRHDAAG
jgi:hypothetical protein